jgi:hypothetical protein
MTRTPPAEVVRTLRAEVGFGCPVPGCGNPYLEFHHFDPPFSVEAHHRSEGMIALCAQHHRKADAGAFTADQLREYKGNRANAVLLKGSFDWLRNDLLAVVGSNFYYETLNIIEIDGRKIVWFRRDEEGYLRLNVEMLSLSPQPRATIEDNIWGRIGQPLDLRSPPSGKTLEIRYENGDWLLVEFHELSSPEAAFERYKSRALLHGSGIQFPITAVEVNFVVASTGLSLSPASTTLPGNNRIIGGFFAQCGGGISVDTGLPWRQNTGLSEVPKYRRNAPCPCKGGRRYKQCHGVIR